MSVCSFANQAYRYDANYAGRYTGGPFKGVLHTTETSGRPGYNNGATAPHFTVLPNLSAKTVTIYQHYDTARPSRALLNPAGGIQTNNDSAIQIELVGTCDPAYRSGGKGVYWPEAPTWLLAEVAKLMRWIESKHSIPCRSTARPWLPYPKSAGSANGQRMSATEWDNFAGWCGHQHVNENDHGDPGNINITYLLAWRPVKTTVVKVATTLAALAAALGISVTSLSSANPTIPSPSVTLTPGTTVTLPANPAPAPAPAPSTSPTAPSGSSTSYKVITAPASSYPLLRKGYAGSAVSVVQRAVGASPDGLFGSGTEAAVKAFQGRHGLLKDGVVGNKTWAVIDAQTRPVLRLGSQSRQVRTVQAAVGAYVDGVFGPQTYRYVVAFQKRHGLTGDGVVGPKTWAVILTR